jgi:hypothetical protein
MAAGFSEGKLTLVAMLEIISAALFPTHEVIWHSYALLLSGRCYLHSRPDGRIR